MDWHFAMENGLLSIPREKKLKPAFVLALLVHVVLVTFLWIGVSWQADTGDMVEAEVWDIKVREAAPLAAGERSELAAPERAEQPVSASEPASPPPPASPARAENREPVKDSRPDIALEQEKRQAEKKAEQEKKAEAKRRAEELKQQQEEQARRKKEADEAKKKQKADEQAARRAKLLLDQEARRIAGGGSGGGKGKGSGGGGTATSGPTGSGGSGTSPYSTGPGKADGGYIQKVAAKIKFNTSFNVPPSLTGNPPVVYDVELLPDGTLRNIRKRKSSGIAGFDEAVKRAIEKSAPYPKDRSGRVPSGFTLTHKPKS